MTILYPHTRDLKMSKKSMTTIFRNDNATTAWNLLELFHVPAVSPKTALCATTGGAGDRKLKHGSAVKKNHPNVEHLKKFHPYPATAFFRLIFQKNSSLPNILWILRGALSKKNFQQYWFCLPRYLSGLQDRRKSVSVFEKSQKSSGEFRWVN